MPDHLEELKDEFSNPDVVQRRLKKLKEQIEAEQYERNENQNRAERKKYANRTFWFIVMFVVLTFVYLGLDAAGVWELKKSFGLTLMINVTPVVLGIFALVMKYLFATNQK